MKTKLALISCFWVACTFGMAARSEDKLPADAVVIESQTLAPNRELVLWMLKPSKHPRDTPDESYTCPEQTRGSYYEGPTRVSLKDTTSDRVINTVKIVQEYDEGRDEFDLPYNIRGDYYYHVEGAKESEGKPVIMWLKDYNGDGKALEFALFDAEACMGLQTTLIGYSEREDKVIQYPVRVVTPGKGKRKASSKTAHWIDYLFSKEPTSPGAWEFEIDYRGRGGVLAHYKVHYDKGAERFDGTLVETGGE